MRNTLKQNEEHSQIKKKKKKAQKNFELKSIKKKNVTEQAHKKAQHQS